ncbi:DUF3515 domain-containing protein [Nocardioides jensenii]|uniref:DUF3515 domain-containing protein n=1 Tax=Nocardioides jensenii TaxID=1843 RepID=UPI000A57DFF5|nr:DUF3515 domain-containing protein [Nocardioides jensenii]
MSIRARGAVASALLLVATGCSGAVEIDSPDVDGATRATCEDFLDALPDTLAGEKSEEVSPDDALGRAWGDPPIVVTCGVDKAEGFTPYSSCWETNGVGWYVPDDQVSDPTADIVATTIGWTPRVEIRLPGELRPPDAVTVDVSAAVKAHLKHEGKPCV